MTIPTIGIAGVPPALQLTRERDVDAAILPALVLDLADDHRPNLGGVADVGAAARLQIDAGDLHQADAAGTGGWLHRHRAHQLGPRAQLLVGDPARRHVVAGG